MSIEKILNKRSNAVVTDGGVDTPKKPTSSQLDNGEIAVNYHKGMERMFMKNDNDEVVEFVSKDEVDKKQDKVDGVNIVRKEFEDDYGPYTEGVVEVDNGVSSAMLRKDEIIFTSDSDKGEIFFEPIGHTIDGKYFPLGVKCKHKKTDDPLYNDLRIARMCDLPSVTPQVQSDWNETDNTKKSFINNKPTIPTKTSDLNNDSKFVSEDDIEGEKVQKTETLHIESDGAVLDSESKLVSDDDSDFYVKPASGTTATLEGRGASTNTYYVNINNNLVGEKQELCRIHIAGTGTLNGRFSVYNNMSGAVDTKVDIEYTNSNNELVTISRNIKNVNYNWSTIGGSDNPIDVKGNTDIVFYVTLNSYSTYLDVDFSTDILQLVVTESKYVIPTKTSELTNDSDFTTNAYVEEYAEPKLNFTTTTQTSSINASKNTYYYFTNNLNSLVIYLPNVNNIKPGDSCGFSFTASSSFSSFDILPASGTTTPVKKMKDFTITGGKPHEVVALYDSNKWLVTVTEFE